LLIETAAMNIEICDVPYKTFLQSGKPNTFFSAYDECSTIRPWITATFHIYDRPME